MKYTTTEKYHTNCPNCGGVIGPNDKFCTYCGTRVVYERTVTREDSFSMDGDIVDIESVAEEGVGRNNGSIGGIAFSVFWCFVVLGMIIPFFAIGGPMGLVPLGMLCFGVANLVKQIKGRDTYRDVVNNAPRYNATVLDHCVYQETVGSGEDRHTVTKAKVKVRANINGEAKVIMIKVGDPENAAQFPEGSSVSIAGRGNYFVIL